MKPPCSPQGEGTRILAPFSLGRRASEALAPLREEGAPYLHSATPEINVAPPNHEKIGCFAQILELRL